MKITEDQFHRIAKALADPTRFAMLRAIAARGEIACQSLVERFGVTPATISHHIKELQSAGLIDARREGKCFHFSVRRPELQAYQAALAVRLKLNKPKAAPNRSASRRPRRRSR